MHCAEVTPQKTLYHIHKLKSFLMSDDKESFTRTRLATHNILDWSCDLDARRLSKFHERSYKWQKGANSTVGKTTGSPRKKKRIMTGEGEQMGKGLNRRYQPTSYLVAFIIKEGMHPSIEPPHTPHTWPDRKRHQW